MRAVLILVLLCSLGSIGAAGEPVAVLRDKIAKQREALTARRRAIVNGESTGKLYEVRGRLAFSFSGSAGIGVARTTVGGKSQLRLVASKNGGVDSVGFGVAGMAGTSEYRANGGEPVIPRVEQREGKNVTALVGVEKDYAPGKGSYGTVGLGFTEINRERRVNFLRLPISPQWKSRALRKVDKALAQTDEALNHLTLAEVHHADQDARDKAHALSAKVDAYLDAAK